MRTGNSNAKKLHKRFEMVYLSFRFSKQKWRTYYFVILAYMNYNLTEYLSDKIPKILLKDKMKMLNLRPPPTGSPSPRLEPRGIPKLLQSTQTGRALTQGSSAFAKYGKRKKSIAIEKLRKGSLVNVLGQIGSVGGKTTTATSTSSASSSEPSDGSDDESPLPGPGALYTLQCMTARPPPFLIL